MSFNNYGIIYDDPLDYIDFQFKKLLSRNAEIRIVNKNLLKKNKDKPLVPSENSCDHNISLEEYCNYCKEKVDRLSKIFAAYSANREFILRDMFLYGEIRDNDYDNLFIKYISATLSHLRAFIIEMDIKENDIKESIDIFYGKSK